MSGKRISIFDHKARNNIDLYISLLYKIVKNKLSVFVDHCDYPTRVLILTFLPHRVGPKQFWLQFSHFHHPVQQPDTHQFTSHPGVCEIHTINIHQLGEFY